MKEDELYKLLKYLPKEEMDAIKKYIENGNYEVALKKIKEWNKKNENTFEVKLDEEKEQQKNEKFPKEISNIELEKVYIRTIII